MYTSGFFFDIPLVIKPDEAVKFVKFKIMQFFEIYIKLYIYLDFN